jgi:uncharacterized protein with von Willebrand factor type A (vWA) domain
MASFVPTFEPKHPQDITLTNEEPSNLEISSGNDYCFIFLVDRSGSMSGSRIETTKTALALFI